MVSLQSLSAAVRRSLCAKHKEVLAEAALLVEKRHQQEALEAAWAAEQKRRGERAADQDGSREAERLARQERQEEERLAFLAAQIIRQTAKSLSR